MREVQVQSPAKAHGPMMAEPGHYYCLFPALRGKQPPARDPRLALRPREKNHFSQEDNMLDDPDSPEKESTPCKKILVLRFQFTGRPLLAGVVAFALGPRLSVPRNVQVDPGGPKRPVLPPLLEMMTGVGRGDHPWDQPRAGRGCGDLSASACGGRSLGDAHFTMPTGSLRSPRALLMLMGPARPQGGHCQGHPATPWPLLQGGGS